MNDYVVLQYLFYITNLGFLAFFDYMAKKRIGVKSQGYLNMRLPKFISLVISSATVIVAVYCLKKDLIAHNMSSFLSIPYFAATSYFIVAFFRELKNHINKKPVI